MEIVNHTNFNWNQYMTELKQLYSIIPEAKAYIPIYNYQ